MRVAFLTMLIAVEFAAAHANPSSKARSKQYCGPWNSYPDGKCKGLIATVDMDAGKAAAFQNALYDAAGDRPNGASTTRKTNPACAIATGCLTVETFFNVQNGDYDFSQLRKDFGIIVGGIAAAENSSYEDARYHYGKNEKGSKRDRAAIFVATHIDPVVDPKKPVAVAHWDLYEFDQGAKKYVKRGKGGYIRRCDEAHQSDWGSDFLTCDGVDKAQSLANYTHRSLGSILKLLGCARLSRADCQVGRRQRLDSLLAAASGTVGLRNKNQQSQSKGLVIPPFAKQAIESLVAFDETDATFWFACLGGCCFADDS